MVGIIGQFFDIDVSYACQGGGVSVECGAWGVGVMYGEGR